MLVKQLDRFAAEDQLQAAHTHGLCNVGDQGKFDAGINALRQRIGSPCVREEKVVASDGIAKLRLLAG
jgi:hypothetical protein